MTKYYCGEYNTKEDAERIDNLMSSLDRLIDFALKQNYLTDISDIEFPVIDVKKGTCDFSINGFNTIRSHYYKSDKERFISYLLARFVICQVKSLDWSDEAAKEELEQFNGIEDDIIKLFPEKAVVIERIKKIDSIYDANGDDIIGPLMFYGKE